jgi:hypothetical protein
MNWRRIMNNSDTLLLRVLALLLTAGFSSLIQGCSSVSYEIISMPHIGEKNFARANEKNNQAIVDVLPEFRIGSTRWYVETPAAKNVAFRGGRDEGDLVSGINLRPEQVIINEHIDKARNLRIVIYAKNDEGCTILSNISGRIEYNGEELLPVSIEAIQECGIKDGCKHEDTKKTIFSEEGAIPNFNVSFGFCKMESESSRRALKLVFTYAIKANPYSVYSINVGNIKDSNASQELGVLFWFSPAISRNKSWH